MDNYLIIKDVSKTYNNKFKALDKLNLSIRKGEIFALLGPNGGEKYRIGDQLNIVWSTKKIYDKTIDLFYSLNGGESWSIIKLKTPNSGTYNWVIDDDVEPSNICKVKVQSNKNKNIFDVSNGLFEIKGLKQAFNISSNITTSIYL